MTPDSKGHNWAAQPLSGLNLRIKVADCAYKKLL
jgi:hypothetical protein